MSIVDTEPPSDLFITDYKKWLLSYRHFIFNNILPRCLPEKYKYRNEYGIILINENAMNIWVVAITDESVDRNINRNYQFLETLGDRMLESIFTNFVSRIYPTITQDTLTEIKSKYMSKYEQNRMAKEIGIHKWLRTNYDVSIHTYEDIFESMFGALYKIGETLIGNGAGYALCTNMITSLYAGLSINENEISLRPRTQIKEIIEKLGWGDASEEKFKPGEIEQITKVEDGDTYKWQMEIRLTKNAKKFLKNGNNFEDNKGFEIISDGLLANGINTNKKTLINQVYETALSALNKYYKIDYKWASNYVEQKNKEIFNDIDLRLKNDGFKKLWFPKPKTTDIVNFLQLVGINDTGQNVILLTVRAPKNIPLDKIKKFAVYIYKEKGKQNPTVNIEYDNNVIKD